MKQHRRSFLKRVGSIGLALPAAGKASAESNASDEDEQVFEAVARGDSSSSSIKNERERRAYIERMRQRYGDTAVKGIPGTGSSENGDRQRSGDVSTTEADDTQNATWMKAWDAEVKVTDNDGTVMATSDNLIDEYQTDIYDENGNRQYFYHHWTSAASKKHSTFEGNLQEFYNHIDFNYSDMRKYDPDQDHVGNGQDVTAHLEYAGDSITAWVESTFTLFEDTVRPHPDLSSVSSDEFAVQWIGDYEGTQAINGVCREDRTSGDSRSFDYEFYLKASKY